MKWFQGFNQNVAILKHLQKIFKSWGLYVTDENKGFY